MGIKNRINAPGSLDWTWTYLQNSITSIQSPLDVYTFNESGDMEKYSFSSFLSFQKNWVKTLKRNGVTKIAYIVETVKLKGSNDIWK